MTGYLANGIAGFLWNVPQGTDGLGSFNYPHVRVLRVNVNNMSAAEDTALYNQSIAYMYPSLHPNSWIGKPKEPTFRINMWLALRGWGGSAETTSS